MRSIEKQNYVAFEDELRSLYQEDQKDREEKLYERDLKLFMERDRLRLTRARELLPYKDQLAPDSLCDLAMLFQHGEGPDDFKRALDLTRLAVEKGYEDARWLAAAAEDRYLLSIGQEQIWGTQFRKSVAGTWEQQPLASDEDSGVTDDKRKEMNVPIRSEQLAIFKQKYGISEEDSGAII